MRPTHSPSSVKSWGVTGMTTEHEVHCGQSDEGQLALSVDGKSAKATLRVSHLQQHFLKEMSPILADMLEVAAYVYAADSAIRRGGPAASQMGKDWRRRLHFRVPVRERSVWERSDIQELLSDTLGFLSEDEYHFVFQDHDGRPIERTIPFLDFRDEGGWIPDEVLMFSGGLDSLTGALEALIERESRVALVSHSSAASMTKVQKDLAEDLNTKIAPGRVRHFPVRAQMKGRALKEGTHRARSFLFAVLGMVVARSFGKERVNFCENGVVSLNLPLLAQHVGTRATRSTHPRALKGLQELFSALLGVDARVGNPLFWRTKTDIFSKIEELNCKTLIPKTRSCANIRQASKMHPHCGRCSQCIDRRFAALAAGMGEIDPATDYAVDLLTGSRINEDRELALAYVRGARRFRALTANDFLQQHPEITRALTSFDLAENASLDRLTGLLNRHGQAVTIVMDKALSGSERPENSLLSLYAATDTDLSGFAPASQPAVSSTMLIEIDGDAELARLNEVVDVRTVKYETLLTFADAHLASLGEGLSHEDFKTMKASELQDTWDLADEATVRRRITELRKVFKTLPGSQSEEIIENIPWHGYRLRPEAVEIRKTKLKT